jgi:hypothetical protein
MFGMGWGILSRGSSFGRHERKEVLLFLKKKKQKDFYFCAGFTIEAMAWILPQAQEIKVFWFFSSEKNIFKM